MTLLNSIPGGGGDSTSPGDADESGAAEPAEPDRPPSSEARSTTTVSFSLDAEPDSGLDAEARRLLERRGPEAVARTLRAAGGAPNPDATHPDATHDVRVLVVGDRRMAAMHEQHRNVPGTTDVLTFDARDRGDVMIPLDVDIVICADEARRQASARGHDAGRELLLYIVHALLHCLGHDDADDRRSREMHACEDMILDAMGFDAVYASEARDPSETTC